MEILKSFIVGLVQGLTEFLPVSSSGHLILSQKLLGYDESGGLSFEIFLHLGSLIAVIYFFRKEILLLIKSLVFFNNSVFQNERRICLWLLIATFVTGVIGLAVKDYIEQVFSQPLVVAIMLSLTGFIVFISDNLKTGTLNMQELTIKKSLFIGLGQTIAIIPGISRSGTTITFGLMTGMKRSEAAGFSFLLSIPVILGANVKEFSSIISLDASQLINYIIGFLAALVSSIFVIKWLINLIVKAKLCYFAYYCWAISVICIIIIIF